MELICPEYNVYQGKCASLHPVVYCLFCLYTTQKKNPQAKPSATWLQEWRNFVIVQYLLMTWLALIQPNAYLRLRCKKKWKFLPYQHWITTNKKWKEKIAEKWPSSGIHIPHYLYSLLYSTTNYHLPTFSIPADIILVVLLGVY